MGTKWSTPPELAKLLGVGHDKILHNIRTGELEAVNMATSRSGRPRYRIHESAIERFLLSRRVVPDGGLSTTKRLRRQAQSGVKEFF
ncbi:MAG: helix-turn-helix domain-containing protein [Pirellulales bacterium]